MKKATSVDEYLAGVEGDERKTLAALRREIRAIVPRSTLHFGPDEPLPTTLRRKLLRARIAEG